jgi:hypothetical protein
MGSATAAAQTAGLTVSVFDGTRNPLAGGKNILFTIFDGFRNQVYRNYDQASSVPFRVPFYDNLGDDYTVIAYTDGYLQAGFSPVKVSAEVPEAVDLMLLPKNAGFNFQGALWDTLKTTHPEWMPLLAHGAADEASAKDRYTQVMEQRPESMASLLNLMTAMSQINLPSGGPLDYFKELVWDDSMARDRFFGYADPALLDQVKRAAKQGEFAPEVDSAVFHTGATDSYKQIQFGEANVQLTFHGDNTKQIDGVDCVLMEPDIDYYKDLAAHALLEVVANGITGSLTDPKQVYVLRWMAGRHAGVPDFDPPYVIS